MARRPARPAGGRVGRLRDRRQMAHVTGARGRPPPRPARGGLGRRGGRPVGAPPFRVVVGAKRHVTLDRALRLLGLGARRGRAVPADDQGRMEAAALAAALAGPRPDDRLRAGRRREHRRVRPARARSPMPPPPGRWLHVDGAFGLWAAASPALRHLVAGSSGPTRGRPMPTSGSTCRTTRASSSCAHAAAHRAAMGSRAAYLIQADPGERARPVDWMPEFSRRARGFAVYAALRSLGARGVAELVERDLLCRPRGWPTGSPEFPACEILNDVVLNQVLFASTTTRRTDDVSRGPGLRARLDERDLMERSEGDSRVGLELADRR